MGRLVHFEIHAADPARAKAFYEQVLGWTFHPWSGGAMEYWLVSTGPDSAPGIHGGMLRRMGAPPAQGQPVNAFVCTADVADVDAAVAAALAHGGTPALPKQAVPGIGWLAYVHDPEGNLVGLMQSDPTAK